MIEANFDKGVVAGVPDLPERPSMELLVPGLKALSGNIKWEFWT